MTEGDLERGSRSILMRQYVSCNIKRLLDFLVIQKRLIPNHRDNVNTHLLGYSRSYRYKLIPPHGYVRYSAYIFGDEP